MRKRQFGSKTLIYASDHNTAQNYMELNIQEVVADAGLYGIISGGDLIPHPVQNYRVYMGPLVARTSTGNRIVISGNETFTVAPSTNPGVGNEIWVTAYISYQYVRSEEDTDGDGAQYYKDYTNGYQISTVQGSIAATGTATRPSIPASAVLLCDILYDSTLYGTGNIQQTDIDISRRFEAGLDEYVRKDGDTMTGALTVNNRITTQKINVGWASGRSYAIGDTVTYGTAVYRCITAHTSTTFAADRNYWQSLSGVSGSDAFAVTSTGQTDFSLSFTPEYKTDIIVTISGVLQHQDAFDLTGSLLSFTEGLITTNNVQVLRIR